MVIPLVVRFGHAPIVRQNFSKMDGMQPISSRDPILTKGAVLGGHGSIGCSLISFYHAHETAHIHQLGTSPAPDDQCSNPFVAKDDQHWKPAQDDVYQYLAQCQFVPQNNDKLNHLESDWSCTV
jgi:hypothetical protein